MPIEEKRKEMHTLQMENREILRLTGVEDVVSFDEQSMVILTCQGALVLGGSDLRIQKYNVDHGELVIEGGIDELVYDHTPAGKKSLLGRLFG